MRRLVSKIIPFLNKMKLYIKQFIRSFEPNGLKQNFIFMRHKIRTASDILRYLTILISFVEGMVKLLGKRAKEFIIGFGISNIYKINEDDGFITVLGKGVAILLLVYFASRFPVVGETLFYVGALIFTNYIISENDRKQKFLPRKRSYGYKRNYTFPGADYLWEVQ